MTTEEEQLFLEQLDKKLWTAADKLRSTLDAAQYKHAVLGLVFLKYVSDSFDHRRQEVEAMLRDEDHDYGVIRSNYESDSEYEATIQAELEIQDYYTETNVFWVPVESRWQFLQDNNKVGAGTELTIKDGEGEHKNGGQFYPLKAIVNLIDEILESFKGRVYDPTTGSGGYFVQSERFIKNRIEIRKMDVFLFLVFTWLIGNHS